MNLERDLQKDGIVVTEKVDTDTVLNITNSISKKICDTFPNFNLDPTQIFAKLFSLNMYKAQMPEGMAEANYCYKNSSIYFNSHISDEDLEEFAIHECLHFLQEVKDENDNIVKMGLSDYSRNKTVGLGLNEAAVQYISSRIIGIIPDYEKYYDINIYTPSPSYYPVECALLNELIFFTGEDLLFKSTFFSTDDFKKEIVNRTSKKTFDKILSSFDKILKYEENIINLNNKILNTNKSNKLQNTIEKYRAKIKSTFFQTQDLIIEEFFDSEYNDINDLEQLETCRRNLTDFQKIIGTTDDYTFFDNYYVETMNSLEHKLSILENNGMETALSTDTSYSAGSFFTKLRCIFKLKIGHSEH